MRRDYQEFRALESEVVAVTADTLANAHAYFRRRKLPFPGLVDETHAVYDLYDVESKFLSLGQRPALFIIDKEGIVRYAHIGTQQWQIPPNEEVLAELKNLQGLE